VVVVAEERVPRRLEAREGAARPRTARAAAVAMSPLITTASTPAALMSATASSFISFQ
jgi:hypothetical protein